MSKDDCLDVVLLDDYHGWYYIISHINNRITLIGRHDDKIFIECFQSIRKKTLDTFHSKENGGDALEIITLSHIPYED